MVRSTLLSFRSFQWCSLFFFLFACTAPQNTSLPDEGSFSVLTYNVHGLPPEVTGDETSVRIAQIATFLSDFDIVGLQEDFSDENHERIASTVRHPYQNRFNQKLSEDRYYGSGLSALSYFPIAAVQNTHYDSCHGYIDASSDCLASKGFQLIELMLTDGHSIHLYNSHLEAGGSDEDLQVRQQQVTKLIDSLQGYSADKAVIFVADTNLHSTDADDVLLLEQLEAEGGLSDACLSVSCPESNHIDRIFYRNGPMIEFTVNEWIRDQRFVDDNGVDLSDHPAIVATIDWFVR